MPEFAPIERSEIDSAIYFSDLWSLIWSRRWTVSAVTMGTAIIALAATFLLPNVYRAEVLLAPASFGEQASGSLSALGGLGSLVGVSLPSSSDKEENLAILTSREFVWRFIDEKNLMPTLFANEWDATAGAWRETDVARQPSRWDAYRLFTKEVLNTRTDPASGLIFLYVEWTDPGAAASWANELTARLNNYLRERAIQRSEKNLGYLYEALEQSQVTDMRTTLYQLIEKEQRDAMLANTQDEFAFRVVDPSVAPDKKVRPQRLFIALMSAFLAFVVACFYLFVRNVVRSNGKA